MNSEIKMSVSSMTRTKDKKSIYVMFQNGEKVAEFSIPGCKVISNKGFNQEELKQLKDYVDNEQDYIFSIAKKVNPMKGFLGKKQGE